ncbi:AF4/FMR2 family member 1 isoform X2 [Salminus brasiliensis]|uniref:AF4/FMR2 family member 1 isoform X2 n=1 Tax=Salminus brasiliensis TaxID=930266 RepID=UPI003B838DF7
MASRATSDLAPNPPRTMAGQSSLREELDVLRRREWQRRNQEAQQDRELYQESTPLFGEPYKTNKGDELSRFVQRMLGNYEDGNNSQSSQYDGVIKDRPIVRSGRPMHKDKTDPSFQNSSSYGTTQLGHPGHGSGQLSVKYSVPQGSSMAHSKEAHLEAHQQKVDAWPDTRDYSALPPVLPDLSPPADPLSPLHSSESSDSDQDTDNENDHSLSPEHGGSSNRREPLHHSESQKEVPQLTGDAPPLASQTFPLPLSSKPNLANSRKPMALVRPMDGPDQVTSESPDLKPSLEDFHGQSYESLPDLKNGSKPSLPPLKVPSQSVETLSNEVQDILREMASWPPLLTAIHTPSTAEPSKFSFPSNEPHVHPGYQQPQKHHESSPKALLSPCKPTPVVPKDGVAAVLAPSSGGESGSSSDSGSSSESESDSESSESGTEENPPVPQNTSPAKEEDRKDISWLLGPFIKKSQPRPNPQNHSEIVLDRDLKTVPSTKPQPQPLPREEETKPRNKQRYHSSHTPPLQVEPTDAGAEAKSASQHAGHKPTAKPTEAGHRKTVGNKQPGKGSKAPRPEDAHASLQVESVEVTPRDKDSTFTDRPKVKTKSSHDKSSKSDSRKLSRHAHSDKKVEKDSAPKSTVTVEDRKETPRSTSPPPKSTSSAETVTPAKSSKKSRTGSPPSKKKREAASRSAPDPPQTLVVKIELSQLSRIPQPPKAAKASKGSSKNKASREKELGSAGKVGKKRPAEKSEPAVPKKKPKLGGSKTSSSSQLNSSKAEAPKSTSKDKERKSSKTDRHPPPHLPPHPPPHPPPHSSSQEQLKGSGHKRSGGELEENSHGSSSKHKKKSSSKEDHSKAEKKTKSAASTSEPPAFCTAPTTHRPLLKFEDRQFSVDYHMKEAKRLKHKADVTLDKTGKAFKYMDAVMSFVESGIAMETDPQTPKSAYTMFSETVDLIRFTLKLKNFCDPAAPASERDFLVLCMRCQALLQMAMFRCKRDSALKYSRTLTDHFKNMQAPSPCISNTGTPSPMSPMPSPASSVSSGLGSNPSSSSTVAIPQVIQQVASSYVNITALFLSAHDTWEQAEELARKGSGMLNELDSAMGQLSLTSSMTPLVRYTRQGLHWLKLDTSNSR